MIAKILIENGAEVDARSKDRQTPLHLAAKYGNENTLKILIDNKADVNSKDSNEFTALHYAVQNGREDIVEALIDSHADVNVKNKRKQTPLDLAARTGSRHEGKFIFFSKNIIFILFQDWNIFQRCSLKIKPM